MNIIFPKLGTSGKNIIYSVLLFIAAFSIYIPSLDNEFVWDDPGSIKSNYTLKEYTKQLNPHKLSVKLPYYRPNIYLSYLIDSSIWGKNPYGYHLTNNILNALVVLLVFWFVYYFLIRLKLQEYASGTAIIASLIFLLHPVHVESVSWVSARTDIICTLFLVLGVLLHLKTGTSPLIILLALIAFYMSMISKEIGVAFLPLILITDLATGEIKKRNSLIKYSLYITLLFLYLYLRSQSHVNITGVSDRNIDSSATDNIIKHIDIVKVFLSTYYTYIYKLLFPIELNAFIHKVIKDTYYIAGAISLITFIIIIFIYSLLKNYRILYLGIFWILLTLGPSSLLSIITFTPTSLAERYLYLPSVGFCLLAGYIFTRLLTINKYKRFTFFILVSIICFFAYTTIDRQKIWKNELTLWEDASSKSEYACLAHNNYGVALRKAGHTREAINQYFYINNPDIICNDIEKSLLYNNLGTALYDINRKDEAIKYYEYSIKFNQYYFRPHLNLGVTYLSSSLTTGSEEDFKKAEYYLNNAVELKPGISEAHHYLSILYKEQGQDQLALKHAEKALKLGLDIPLEKDSLRILNELQNKKP